MIKLERRQMLQVEGGSEKDCLRFMRHETGHAIDNAFNMHKRRRYRDLAYHRIRVPRFAVFPPNRKVKPSKRLIYPLFVKSLSDEGSVGISQASVVRDDEKLKERVEFIHRQNQTAAIVEEFIEGREILDLSGYARIDYRLTEGGRIYALEVNPNPQIARHEDFADSAEHCKVKYEALLRKIMTLGMSYDPVSR